MILNTGSKHGFRPVCIFGRKAKNPLPNELSPDVNSWEMLGTNLSLQSPNGTWTTDTTRLILMDRNDFSQLGLSIDDLIDAYIQTVLAVIGIDRMAKKLLPNGEFDYKLFKSLNPDNALIDEIRQANGNNYIHCVFTQQCEHSLYKFTGEQMPSRKPSKLSGRFGPKRSG